MIQARTQSTWGFVALLCTIAISPMVFAQSRLSLSAIETGPAFPKSLLSNAAVATSLDREISTDTSSEYLRRLANAVSFIQSGSSADYSVPFEHLILNVGAGLGYQAGYTSFEDVLAGRASPDQLAAISAQAMISVGVHFQKEQRSRFFLSFASSDYSKGAFSVENSGWGLLWQYDAVRAPAKPSPLFSWNGIKLGTGFRWNRLSSKYSRDLGLLGTQLNVPGYGDVGASMDASMKVAGDVSVMSVPLEIGTSLRWMSVLSLYGVAGADAHFGRARGSVLVRGPVSVEVKTTNTEGDTESKVASAEGRYAVEKTENPDPFSLRGLVGLQFELGRGSVFVQYQRSNLEESEAAALGFRTYF